MTIRMPKDYYKVLGIDRNASGEEIKKAFRSLAHTHHPDKGGDPEKFKELNEANQVLSDPEKRQQYDQFGQTFEQAQAGGGFGGSPFGFGQGGINMEDLGDIFGDLFGGRARGGPARAGRRSGKGKDIEMDMTLEFREAAFGAERTVELYKTVKCDRCDGSGGEPGSKITTCETCKGAGQVIAAQRTVFGSFQIQQTCPTCAGEGKSPSKRCVRCDGTGLHREKRKVELKIPAGVDDGELLRLSGEGEAGFRGGAAGDLFVRVHVRADPGFNREGTDVRTRAEVGFTTPAPGGTITVPTPDGEAEVSIPAGTQSGALLRLRGKGIPKLCAKDLPDRQAGRGDQVIEVIVKTPSKLSRDQKRHLEEIDLE